MINFLTYINWNFDPEIFSIGTFSVRWYGMLFAGGFLFGYNQVEKMFKNENENLKWLDSLFIYLIVATVVGARLGHVFFYGWEYYSKHLIEILYVRQGGLASHGGFVGILIAMIIWSKYISKRSVLWVLDRVVVPTALVGALIRFGNLLNSEIYGVQTTLPWGFIFERNNEIVPKHPTQIYEMAGYLLTFGVLMFMYWKSNAKKFQGLILGVFFIMIFGFRFLIEFVKEDQEAFEAGMSLNMGQWLSIPIIIAGIGLIYYSKKKGEVEYNEIADKKKTK